MSGMGMSGMSSQDMAVMQQLQNASGSEFNTLFVSQMLSMHEAKLSEYRNKIQSMDPDNKLTIFELSNTYKEDPLVLEYINNLLQLNIIPQPPSSEEADEFLNLCPDITLGNSDLLPIITNWMTILQMRYFSRNVTKATESNIGLFNPVYKFSIPAFNLLPAATLENITLLKQDLTRGVQLEAIRGSQFGRELLILRNLKALADSVQSKGSKNIQETVLHYNALCYRKATMEFYDQYQVKDISWEGKTTKVRHTQPKWRKEEDPIPPVNPTNFYARNLSNRIASEDLSSHNIISMYHVHTNTLQILRGRLVSSTGIQTGPIPNPTQSSIPSSNANRNVKKRKIVKTNQPNPTSRPKLRNLTHTRTRKIPKSNPGVASAPGVPMETGPTPSNFTENLITGKNFQSVRTRTNSIFD